MTSLCRQSRRRHPEDRTGNTYTGYNIETTNKSPGKSNFLNWLSQCLKSPPLTLTPGLLFLKVKYTVSFI